MMKSAALIVLILVLAGIAIGQKQTSANMFDVLGKTNGEERSAHFDSFFAELANAPASSGYVFVYCGKSCAYGEIERHLRGIELKIAGRKFDRERIVVLPGGYRDSTEVELWTIPPGAAPPIPKSTRNIKEVAFTPNRGGLVEPYDCCEDLNSDWKRFKPRAVH